MVFSNLPQSAHFWEVDLSPELDYRFECPSEELFGAVERSLRQDAAATLAPLGTDASGGPKTKKRGLKTSQSASSSGYSTASGRSRAGSTTSSDSGYDPSPQQAPPQQGGLKKTSSGRLVKQMSYSDLLPGSLWRN
jgi:hypothetical protein